MGTPINFDNLEEKKKPSDENEGFAKMDTVDQEADESTETTGDEPKKKPGEIITSDEIAKREENKLPPATELAAEEENPEQRKIAGEAPHVTASNPTAFTPEKEGGIVDYKGKSKEEINTTTPVDNSVPEL